MPGSEISTAAEPRSEVLTSYGKKSFAPSKFYYGASSKIILISRNSTTGYANY